MADRSCRAREKSWGRTSLKNTCPNHNTVHLTILMAFRMLIAGRGLPWRGRIGRFAHLALDAAEIAAIAAGDDAFLEYFAKHRLMKGSPLRRGE